MMELFLLKKEINAFYFLLTRLLVGSLETTSMPEAFSSARYVGCEMCQLLQNFPPQYKAAEKSLVVTEVVTSTSVSQL